MLKPGNRPAVDIWVIDCDDPDAIAEDLADIDNPVVALSNRPDPDDKDAYRYWGDRILRTLDRWTANAWHSRASEATSRPERFAAVKGVWLLAGSAGMEAAVAEFFEAMPRVPPVAFLYAQHVESGEELALTNRLNKANRNLQCTLATGRHWLNPGQVLVIPASARVQFGQNGEVFSLRNGWEGRVEPYIDQLMMSLTGIKPSGVIMFSGAATDGLKGAHALRSLGTRVWAQEPETATEPGLPKWVDRLHLSSNVGSPAELAGDLLARYPLPAAKETEEKSVRRDNSARLPARSPQTGSPSRSAQVAGPVPNRASLHHTPAMGAVAARAEPLPLPEVEEITGYSPIPLPLVEEISAEDYADIPLPEVEECAAELVSSELIDSPEPMDSPEPQAAPGPQVSPPLLEPSARPTGLRSLLARAFGNG